MFTICQLGGLNTLHTESQPAKHVILGPPPPASFSSVLGAWGEGSEAGYTLLPGSEWPWLWFLFSRLFLPYHSLNSRGGWKSGVRRDGGKVPMSEGVGEEVRGLGCGYCGAHAP